VVEINPDGSWFAVHVPGELGCAVMKDSEFYRALGAGKGASFDDTNWWTVREAGKPELPEADAARTSLCRTYWYPIYCYVRGLGHTTEDAQDLTQEFFARLMKMNYLQAAAQEKGKFRSYLLLMLKRFLADQWDRTQRQKRGGGTTTLSLDGGNTEFFRRHEPADPTTPDRVFDRLWAESLLQQALERLEQECAAAGKKEQFEELRAHVTCETETTCAVTAAKLGMTVSNLKVTVHRLRERYRALLRAEIARTAATEAEVEEELRDFYAALR
jgi:RNA polymerase sigma factor (sigma-70 family)